VDRGRAQALRRHADRRARPDGDLSAAPGSCRQAPRLRRTPLPTKLNLQGLAAATADSKAAASSSSKGPADLATLEAIKTALAPVRHTLPPVYRDKFYDPLLASLNRLTPGDFQSLKKHPDNTPFWDVLQAVLQNASGYESKATDAFQEVVSDLFDGFLSAEDRVGVKPPDSEVIPPLVKWGNPDAGPYTWPVDSMGSLKIEMSVVSLPPAHAHGGLLGWATLGHETGGHDILGADKGLLRELTEVTHAALLRGGQPEWMAAYWSERIDETGADVLGLINMGPAAGIGMIGYFRGLMGAWTGVAKLRSDGPAEDPHPGDVVRAYLAAASVRRLSFAQRSRWAAAIEAEADKDAGSIRLAGHAVTAAKAKQAAAIVAKAIADTPLLALEKRSLRSIQDWHDADEAIATALRPVLAGGGTAVPANHGSVYATHVVAAAVIAAVLGEATPAALFAPMVGMLKAMHDDNPSWGPLFVGHRGDGGRHLVAVRPREGTAE
jgi:hypothetical protein